MAAFASNSNATIEWLIPGNYVLNGQSIYSNSISTTDMGVYIATASYGSCVAKIVPQVSHNWLTYGLHDSWGQQLSPTQVTKIVNANLQNLSSPLLGVVADSVGCLSYYARYFGTGDIIEVPNKPQLTSNSPVCNGGDVKISSGEQPWSLWGFDWTGPGGNKYLNSDLIFSSSQHPKGTSQYILRLTNNGCFSEPDTINVAVGIPTSPKVAITANPGFNTGPYVPVTYTANVLDTGATVSYQWYKSLGAIPGATNKTLKLTTQTDIQAGEILTVRINTDPVCATTNTADSPPQTIGINLGIDDVNNNEIRLYPNPVHDVLTVSGLEKGATITITTITGKQVEADIVYGEDKAIIHTEQLADGNYLLRSGDHIVRFVKAQ